MPERESELVELTRDYETLQETYTSLLTKKEDSKLAANLERGQIGEQFRILDPASLPERPSNQEQRLTMGIGASLGGLVSGCWSSAPSSIAIPASRPKRTSCGCCRFRCWRWCQSWDRRADSRQPHKQDMEVGSGAFGLLPGGR